MGTLHKHCNLIVAWANGADIQYLDDGMWTDCSKDGPHWYEEMQYRMKPALSTGWVNIYQNTAMSAIYKTKELADKKEQSTKFKRVDCVQIQWSSPADVHQFINDIYYSNDDELDDELEDE